MKLAPRKPSDLTQQIIPLTVLGIGLVTTNRSVTFIDDESQILNCAVEPVRQMLARFVAGHPLQPHPPLFDILLHFWLRWTDGNFDYLRLPSIFLFLAGLFLLARAGHYFGGSGTSIAIVWAGVLWPFGFHYGRLAVWYSFSFLLVSGLTLAYLKYLEGRTLARWLALLLFSLALIWTTYFGWAIVACLAVDRILRREKAWDSQQVKDAVTVGGLLVVSYIPLWRAVRYTFDQWASIPSLRALTANLGFNVFSLFVSESIAPWSWRFSIPAAVAILACIALAIWFTPGPARRFLFYSALLIVAMAAIGILNTRRLLTVAPWVLLPVGAAIESAKPRWATFTLAGALLVTGLLGWYGIYAKRYYSAPRFIEPWQVVAGEAALQVQSGATVIADHPAFLLYLTYALQLPRENGPWRFEGVLPATVKSPQIFYPAAWLASGVPARGKILLVRGAGDPAGSPIDQAAERLDQSCGSISSRLRMRDEGYNWKQRFFPNLGEPQWRIEIREYDCELPGPSPAGHPPAS